MAFPSSSCLNSIEKINKVTAEDIKIMSNVLNDLLSTSVMEIISQTARIERMAKNSTRTVNTIAALFLMRLFMLKWLR